MWIVAILSVIAAVVSAVGAKQTASAQEDAAKYNADVEKNNAETAAQQGQFDAQQIRDRNKRTLAAQRAAFSASGLDESGSVLDVRDDSAAQGEMDALVAIYTGQTSANASMARARLDNMQGAAARRSGNIGAASSLLGGATSGAYYGSIAYSGSKSNPKFK